MRDAFGIIDGPSWLFPAVQALGGWIADNRPLAERAVREAIRRNDAKTAMFFAVVAQRYDRRAAAAVWLNRYFRGQRPSSMDGNAVAMWNAAAAGAFGSAALSSCLVVWRNWLRELDRGKGFREAQVERWKDELDHFTPAIGGTQYPALRRDAPDAWPAIERALRRVRRNQAVLQYFFSIVTGGAAASPSVTVMAPEFLESLIRAGSAETDAIEHSLMDFAAMMAKVIMHPDAMAAAAGAQRCAVALCKEWILAAHCELSARDRLARPSPRSRLEQIRIPKTCTAELADLQRELRQEDAKADALRQLLDAAPVERHILQLKNEEGFHENDNGNRRPDESA